ncbi:hypothetical protein U0E23_35460 [Burkholderia stagnalis]|nr:hypothetical protein [Burkholderia stagnalis]MDY7807724.1 hypothetical protein [Burkholderia stagnalis]
MSTEGWPVHNMMLGLHHDILVCHGKAEVDSAILAGAKAFHRDAKFRLQQVTHEQLEVDRR